ncbi:MAG: hypothetical protein Q8P41_21675 [Pseudomonadota bacterium]|nr:hypothetical protein [Pseudomonadota bacterium]
MSTVLALLFLSAARADIPPPADAPQPDPVKTAACMAGTDEVACIEQGALLHKRKDFVGAEGLLRPSCDRGAAPSCRKLGDVLMERTNPKRSTDDGYALFEKACNGNDGEGCMKQGTILTIGLEAIQQDGARALVLMDKACKLGNARGCEMAEGLRATPTLPPSQAK